jgi:triosephosphate isomerase
MTLKEWTKRIAVNLSRLIIGPTFIFSGYVKAIDPLGTQYKMTDYLTALHLADFVPSWLTLLAAVLLAALEFSLGIFMLFAIRRRLVSKIVAAFMVVMTLITVWIALANPVKDCGCFGDAIHLTNTQTLLKNIVLLACAVVVARWPLLQYRFISKSNQWIAINFTILFILITSGNCLYKLPTFDFRPYHIGANIEQGMTIPPGAPQPEFATTFILEKNGVRKEFTLDNYPDSTWTFIDSKTVQTAEGYVPPIHDFSLQTLDGKDVTHEVLRHKGYTFLLVSPHLEDADDSNFGAIDQIYEYAQAQNIPFYCVTASSKQAMSHWEDLTGAEYPYLLCDETTLKTVIRSNPGLLLLNQGTIIRKWSHNDLPMSDQLTMPLEKAEIGQMDPDTMSKKIVRVVLWFFLPLFLLSLADRTWAWTKYVRKKMDDGRQKLENLEHNTLNIDSFKRKDKQ